jgi:hypothetical protein
MRRTALDAARQSIFTTCAGLTAARAGCVRSFVDLSHLFTAEVPLPQRVSLGKCPCA